MHLLLKFLINSSTRIKTSLLVVCLSIQIFATAQLRTLKYYNWAGDEVSMDQAYSYAEGRILTGKDLFVGKVVEKYISNKKIKSKKTFDEKGMQTGVGTEYFENGQVKEKYQLKHGHVFGGYISWYPNGQKEVERQYTAYSMTTGINYLTYNFWDSLGNQLVKDGEGNLEEYYADYSVSAKGRVYKGKRSGTWRGYYPNGNSFYVEKYKKGELTLGNSTRLDSTKYRYNQISSFPTPTIGFSKYYEKLSKELKYPKSAKKIGIQGTVLIAYTINDSGQVTDFYINKSLTEDCDREAMRLFSEVSTTWIAGTSRGNPKSFIMMLPVSFKL